MDVPKTRVIVAVVGQMVIQGTCTGHLNGQVVTMLVKIQSVVRYHVYNWTTVYYVESLIVAIVGQMVGYIQDTCTGHLNGQVVSMVLIRCVVSSREYTQTLMLH